MSPSVPLLLLWTVARPVRSFHTLDSTGTPARWGIAAALGTALAWSAFQAWLAAAGHEPSGPLLLPVDRASYYAAEALFGPAVRLAMLAALSLTVARLSRWLGGTGTLGSTVAVCGWATAVPSLLAFLIPDVAVLAIWGFEAMGSAMPFYLPVYVLWSVVLITVAVRTTHSLPVGRALLCGLVGVLVHEAVGSPFLR